MSLTLNMVGGGGSFTATDAILRVQAPSNSIVTIIKGSTTKTDLGHENLDRPTTFDYYFIIHQSQFDSVNAWTVTATRGSESNTATIIIDAPDEYDVSIGYHVPIDLYQEVEYVGTSNSANFTLKESNISGNIRLVATIASSAGGTDGLLALENSRDYSGGVRTELYVNSNNNYVTFTYPGTDGKYLAPCVYNELVDVECLAPVNNGTTWKIGEYSNYDSVSLSNINRLYVFFYRGSNSYYHKGRVQHVALYENDVLTRDCWACYRLSDSKAGMWDKVTETFFVNDSAVSGSSFYVGADV